MNKTRRRPRRLFVLLSLLACACLAAYALAPPRLARAQDEDWDDAPGAQAPDERKEEPKSVVYGRAVYEGTSRPVRRARITLADRAERARRYVGLTDANGEFRIGGVTPGHYFAFVIAGGVISPVSFIPLAELSGGAPDLYRPELRQYFDEVEVDGKGDKELTVRARRGAAIGGKVTYANGDPAINVRVHIMRRGESRLSKFMPGSAPSALAGLNTDDRGMFRVAGLPPGEYVVGVSEMADHTAGGDSRTGAREFMESYAFYTLLIDPLLTTYYPSTPRAADATVIKVEAGDERDDVDITVAERELRSIGGIVRGRRDRRPVANARVTIARKSEGGDGTDAATVALFGEMTQTSVRTDAEGRWRLKDLPDGEYTLHAAPPDEADENGAAMYENLDTGVATNANVSHARPRKKTKRYASGRRDVKVAADIDDLAIELSDGARIRGSITFEGGKPPEYNTVFLAPGEQRPGVHVMEAMPGAPVFNGAFQFEGLAPGKYYLQPRAHGPDEDSYDEFYVKSINWNGRDLLREPLEVGEGASVEGVRVVYARGPARLLVRVTTQADKEPARRALVLLAPASAQGWSVYGHNLQCHTDDEGTCEVAGAPGDYKVVALAPHLLASDTTDFEAEINLRAATAPRVTLRAAETKDIDIVLPGGGRERPK
ncbi:MAG TPA: carboxypeptidase-like regulatory domain-containing protein [Pyrinomonadaceae bacterium]|nr:carboxypeptidase-like regulatory domain-containing protein [Pyrinomonadaceae bacterium]